MISFNSSSYYSTFIAVAIYVTFLLQVSQAFHHHLTKRELQKVFGVEHKSQVPEYALMTAHSDRRGDDGLNMQFTAWNSTYRIELKPNLKLISPHLVSVIRDGNSSSRSYGLPPNLNSLCHFHGRVTSHANVSAAISNCNTLMGTIVMDDHFLVIQSIPERLKDHQKERHVVYKREAGLLTPLERSLEEHLVRLNDAPLGDEFCDVSEAVSFNYSVPSTAKLESLFIFSQLDPITLEIGLFLDSKLYEHFQREFVEDPEQHLMDFSLALINNVHVLYQQSTMSPNLDIVIVRFELWKSQPLGLETYTHRNGQAQTLLNGFCRHQAAINPGSDLTDSGHWDHGILLTGYDIYHTTTSVAGVAPVARMCDEIFACSLVEGMHLGRSFVLAHEMGHNMGMVHDGIQNQCGRSCCLMSPVNGAGKTTWSPCSVREFNAFLLQLDESGRGNCLRDTAENIPNYNHLKDGRLPGQRFTADQQCSYFWGKDYQVEIPNGKEIDDICRILWCGNGGSTISTAHPALEGSWCGGNKFCMEGKCREWQNGPRPALIDGGWSPWSEDNKPCPISQCQISGSIQLKAQTRTCTNPAPNNGGESCFGASVRGLVCGSVQSACEGLSRLEYGTRLCTSTRNDPEKPDLQLSGSTFLHGSQPCKIWCHLSDSEMIRNKGQYPDGSPCGVGQYCIGGNCLAMTCNNKAVVSNPHDCPQHDIIRLVTSKWGDWTSWSHCSASCGVDLLQTRHRQCLSPSNIGCVGEREEKRKCDPMPAACEEYSGWSEWSFCSVTCGGGKRSRARACISGTNCVGRLNEESECNEEECPSWKEWAAWSECSASCGGGQRSRSRDCSVFRECQGEGTQIEGCNSHDCTVEAWGDWLPCSVSCGSGFQIRERLCSGVLCNNGQRQARTCNQQDCAEVAFSWDAWSEWLPCSETCGEGVQVRVRKCIKGSCPDSQLSTDQRRCVLRPCPQWSVWGEWSVCGTCDSSETRQRQRNCVDGLVLAGKSDVECTGSSTETGSCETSCNIVARGVKTKPLDKPNKNKGLSATTPNSIQESTAAGIYESWQAWKECTASCGGGTRHRVRSCPEGDNCLQSGAAIEIEACNEQPCEKGSMWTEWGEWEPCSTSCGDGRQSRHRKCKAAFVFLCDGFSNEQRPCRNTPCPTLPDPIVTVQEIQKPKWSGWSAWSQCSCFTMNQFRRRYCEILDPAVQGFCTGSIIEQRSCVPTSCLSENGEWSDWSGWSKCSRECGANGHQLRNRMCSNPVPSNRGSYCIGYSFDQRVCSPSASCVGSPVNGAWTEWSQWSECSDKCNNGHKSRTRYCSNPAPSNGGAACFGSDFELEPCSNPSLCLKSENGNWAEWSGWSECSAPCGFAFQSRHRYCNQPPPSTGGEPCYGLAYMTSICKTDFCKGSADGQWSTWNEWTSCVANCGVGSRTRKRTCTSPPPTNGGYPCFGRSSEASECTPDDGNASDASMCSTAIANARRVEDHQLNSVLAR